ncbi:MarR family transcriptional regulator [bacterium]|nr:MarR family transcriptional regulator [bacterium]
MGTKYKGNADEVRVLNAIIKLTRATNSLYQRLEKWLRSYQLTPTQFGILEMLVHVGPMCQRSIAAKTLTSGGNITTVLNTMEQNGWVIRTRSDQDKREVIVRISSEGESLIQSVFPAHLNEMMDAFAILSHTEQDELARLCAILGKQQRLAS